MSIEFVKTHVNPQIFHRGRQYRVCQMIMPAGPQPRGPRLRRRAAAAEGGYGARPAGRARWPRAGPSDEPTQQKSEELERTIAGAPGIRLMW
jgi:hypothetical protein